MDIEKVLKLSKTLSVGPAPTAEMIETLAERGYKSVINLSKKGELNQPMSPEEEGTAVKESGMSYIHHPVTLSSVKDEQIAEFCEMVDKAEGPIYVHCRIGQRAIPFGLICHALRKKLSTEKLLKRAEKLGIKWDVPFIRDLVLKYLKQAAESKAAAPA